MLNPARGRAERGDREDKAPALGEREVPTPTRGLVTRVGRYATGSKVSYRTLSIVRGGRGGGEVRVQLASNGIQSHMGRPVTAQFQEQAAKVTPKYGK